MKKVILKRNGFTIIEMILYAGLLVIFLGVLSNLFVSALDIKVESEAASFSGQDVRFIFSKLNYDLKRADSIIAPGLGTTSTTLTLSIDGINHTYSLSEGKLVVADGLGSANLNGNQTEISGVFFERIGNAGGKNTIKINLTLDGKDYSTTVGIR
ncbi:MAG: hypothetical protein AAB656_03840 [Patescibacteria group bacterium]